MKCAPVSLGIPESALACHLRVRIIHWYARKQLRPSLCWVCFGITCSGFIKKLETIIMDCERNHSMRSPMDGTPPQSEDDSDHLIKDNRGRYCP